MAGKRYGKSYGRGSSYTTSSSQSYSGYGSSKYSSNNWNWGTYSTYGNSLVEEDDELFIKNNDGYFTPRIFEIESRLPYGTGSRNAENIKLIKEMSRFFFYKMMNDKDYIDVNYHDETIMSEEMIEEKNNKVAFYEELWGKFIPGFTPLEKAISLFTEINNKNPSGNNTNAAERLKLGERVDLETIKFEESLYMDPEYNELLDMEFFKKRGFKKVNILNKISLVKNLGAHFKIEKEIEEKLVPNSNLIAKKMMRDYSQVFNVDLYQRLFPDFKSKLATKNLTVNVPIDKTEHKQKIIILLDFSGSMSSVDKQEWVLAILLDRLKYAMIEEAEVFFSYFVNNPDQMEFHHIKDRKSAINFWKRFSTNPNGGGTDIGSMIERIKNEIDLKGRLMNLDIDLSEERPEVLIINDGQDNIQTNNFVYKTNAISLYQNNSELKGLCVKNDGKYVYVSGGRDNVDVTTYSKEGTEKLII